MLLSSSLLLLLGIILILVASTIFCNAIEHLGESLNLSEGLTGSVFVAVGTALPETIVPVVAILGATNVAEGHDIGIGAILGAPLMLSTLSLCIIGIFGAFKRGARSKLNVEPTGLKRDLNFFIFGYGLSLALGIFNNFYQIPFLHILVSCILCITYFTYVLWTIKASKDLVSSGGNATESSDELYLTRFLKLPHSIWTVLIQSLLGLVFLVYVSHFFVGQISSFSHLVGISSFILSLIIIPIATELPEKFNSIMWMLKGKDTLAMSNVSGALTFQGVLLPVLGITMTNWVQNSDKIVSVLCPIIAALWIKRCVGKSSLSFYNLILLGALYIVAIISMLVL